jgi:ParB-like chromosome segregation protein Spo0J
MTVAQELNIKYHQIDSLIAYERNARTHSKYQIRQIARSIKEFGFTNPILINRDRMIIAGHGRVQAANTLGINQVRKPVRGSDPRLHSGRQ